MLEASYYGYKSICSYCTFFNKHFKVSNTWKSKDDYKNLLNVDFKKLNYSNKRDILYLIYMIFRDDRSYSGKNFWQNIVIKSLGFKSIHMWHKKVELFSNTKNPEHRNNIFKQLVKNKLVKNKEQVIIKRISTSINII